MKGRRVALVTGAQRGIGRAIALAAARKGFAIALNYAEEEKKALALIEEIRALRADALPYRANVSDVTGVYAMVAAVEAQLGAIDVLVNNAGIFPRATFLEMTEALWDNVISVNLKGTCFVAQACAQSMIRSGRGGSIINLASSAIQGVPNGSAYVASKGGVVALTRSMAVELGSHNIRVNAIAPGLTNTEQPRQGLTEEQILARARSLPLGRMAEPEDIARMAVFLMTDESSMVTGQTLHINGGDYRP